MSTVAPSPPLSTSRPLSPRSAGWGTAALVAAAALYLAWKAGVKGFGAVPAALQVTGAVVLVFGVPGYAVARLLLSAPLQVHLPLFVLPIGACVSGLGLTVLGFAGLPLTASLVVVIGAGAAAWAWVTARGAPSVGEKADGEAGGVLSRIAWPTFLAVAVACLGLLPMLRAGEPVLTGANGDAVLAVGVADFLQRTPPRGTDETLYVDRMPSNWRSKYPIYYALAGVSRLSGLPIEQAFPPLMAIMLGLTAVGLMLLAFHTLSAGAVGALLAMAIVGLDRILVYLTVGPFYNQIWGEFALAFLFLFVFGFLRRPERGTAALMACFGLLGAFAYPLMLPFPLAALVAGGAAVWLSERAQGRRPAWAVRLPSRRSRTRTVLLGLGALVALPALLVAGLGVYEKGSAALGVILPGSDLRPWNALPVYLPFHQFFGLVDPFGIAFVGVAAIIAIAFYGLRRQAREVAVALGVICAGALLFAAYFRMRDHGAFFYFKILGFAGPIILLLAVVALAREYRESGRALVRTVSAVGLGLLALSVVPGVRTEVNHKAELFTEDTRELREWSAELARGDSVLLALPPNGAQLNATSMLSAHPLSSPAPLGSSTFPSVALGFTAEWVLTDSPPRASVRGAIEGRPRFANDTFRLYRLRPTGPVPDRSTQRSFENAPWGQAGVATPGNP